MSAGTGKNAPQGKIARLPHAIREELNIRLLDGQSARVILDWLNAHPDVIKILGEDFEGLRVSDANLSNYRKSEHARWISRRDHVQSTKEMAQWSMKLAEASGGQLAEGAAQIAAGKILAVLEDIAELQNLPTEKTPEQIAALSASLASLTEAIGPLRTGDQNNRRLDQNDERLEIMRTRATQAEELLRQGREKIALAACTTFIRWYGDQRSRDIMESGLSNAEKITKLRQTYFADIDALEKTGEVELPK